MTYARSQEHFDELVSAGWCAGSEYTPRMFNEHQGMCVVCSAFFPVHSAVDDPQHFVVERHRPSSLLDHPTSTTNTEK